MEGLTLMYRVRTTSIGSVNKILNGRPIILFSLAPHDVAVRSMGA